jgi:type IV pilus assembly protein PilW
MRALSKIRFLSFPRRWESGRNQALDARSPTKACGDRLRGHDRFLVVSRSGQGRLSRQQGGFSLVELMIALLLGLLLMSGIIAVYLESKNSFVQDEAISRVQENGRFALRLLTREIAMGGFYAGVTTPEAISSPAGTDACQTWLLNPDEVIETYDNADSGEDAAFGTCTLGAVAGTDVLAVRRASDKPLIHDGNWQDDFETDGLTDAQYYLHTENSGLGSAEIKLGSDLDGAALTATTSTADVWNYFGRIYYIGTDPVGTGGIPSLCTRTAQNTAQTCLVSGVENLQIELGIDQSGDGIPDEFVPGAVSPGVGGVDVATVVSMRVHLLMRSPDLARNFAAASRDWTLGDETITTNDQYYRRVFTATVPRSNQIFTTYE